MKGAILSAAMSAGTVAAQLTVAPGLFNVAAVDIDDPGYTTCSVMASYVSACVNAVGGSDALTTANPYEVYGCVCCAESTPVYDYYSACSTYLSEEGGSEYSDTYSAYSELYSVCGAADLCTTDSGFTITSSGSSFATETGSITAVTTMAEACTEMVDIYSSCSSKISGFDDLNNRERASCYCCATSGGTVTWTDAMDSYASTCADWAESADTDIYSAAKTFSTWCDHFSDVCSPATATDSSESTITGDSNSESTETSSSDNNDPVTVTVQSTQTGSSGDNAGTSVRVGFGGAALAAVLALAVAL